MLATEERLFLTDAEVNKIVDRGGVNIEELRKQGAIRTQWVNGGKSMLVICKSVEQRRAFQKQCRAILFASPEGN